MKFNIKAFAILALVVSVVLVSGCSQQPAANGATPSAAAQIKSTDQAKAAVVDTSKDVKKISDTLAGIDKTLGGTK